jgi:hypothetical protein
VFAEVTSVNKKFGFLIFTGVFILSLALVFCAGYYRKRVTMEAGRFYIDLVSNEKITKSKTAIYDIQNEGIPKKLVQPDKISISIGHGSGITNSSDKPIWLSIKVTGIKGTAKILSNNPIFDEKTECCLKPLMPDEVLDVNVNLDLPDEALNDYLVSKCKIEFFDYKSNKKLGEVPLKIINSKPKKSCCTIDDGSY